MNLSRGYIIIERDDIVICLPFKYFWKLRKKVRSGEIQIEETAPEFRAAMEWYTKEGKYL